MTCSVSADAPSPMWAWRTNPARSTRIVVGPSPNAEPLPDRGVVVLHHRVADPEPPGRRHHPVVGALPEELRSVDAHDREPPRRVPLVPLPQLRDHVLAVDSTVGPELHQHHAPAEPGERQRLAVDPGAAGQLRRRLSRARRALRVDPARPSRERSQREPGSDHERGRRRELHHRPPVRSMRRLFPITRRGAGAPPSRRRRSRAGAGRARASRPPRGPARRPRRRSRTAAASGAPRSNPIRPGRCKPGARC